MPTWLNWAWISQRLFHGAIYVVASVAVVLALYKLFIKETNKTVYTQPVTQLHYFENFKTGAFSCARIPELKK